MTDMKKTTVPVVFTFDENYAPGAGVAIQSLLANQKDTTEYDIYALYTDLKDETRDLLSRWHPINWIKLDIKMFEGLPVTERYNVSVWYGSAIPEILTDLDRVIYSDVDVLFKCDLAELFAMHLRGKCCAAVPECYNNIPDRDCRSLMGDIIYIGDIIVMNLARLRKLHSCRSMFETGKKIGITPSMQMDIFNIVAKDEIVPLPLEYDIPDFVYHNPHGGGFQTEIYSAERVDEALRNAKRIHYTADHELNKIWEWPPEEIPQEYLQYLVKTGLYKYGTSLEG